MKRLRIPAIAICASILATASASVTFSTHSQMSSGKWVKIGVRQKGVYALSYERLRDLGFSNPEKVGVWGEGGKTYSVDFVNQQTQERMIPDRMTQIKVWHHNGKLYFFGEGPDDITWQNTEGYAIPGHFSRNNHNIYTLHGTYFLSDSEMPSAIASNIGSPENVTAAATTGYSWYHHEKDMTQGIAHSGQTFWGESMLAPDERLRHIPYRAPQAAAGAPSLLDVRFNGLSWVSTQLNIGMDGAEVGESTVPFRSQLYRFICENTTRLFNAPAPQENGTVAVQWIPDERVDITQGNLDYIMLTYCRNLEFAADENQFIVNTLIDDGNAVKVPAGNNVQVWDITDCKSPLITGNKEGYAYVDKGNRDLLFFIADKVPEPDITGTVANRDFRAELIAANPAMVIITTRAFEQRARQLADFHYEYDKVRVSVAVTEDIYNDFSSGRPDPMAYRAMLRMLYEQPGSNLKAVLLYGPQLSNIRGEYAENPREAVITYQYPDATYLEDCLAYNDIYGMFGDSQKKYISAETMHIAVGSLPVMTDAEAERYYNKLVRYYFDDSRAYWIDRMALVADDKDYGNHMRQLEQLSGIISNLNDSTSVYDKLYFGEYGYPGIKQPMYDSFHRGNVLVEYFGHGSPRMIGHDAPLLNSNDIMNFNNRRLGFMTFASCETTLFELGWRGVSEHMLLSTENGLIGMLGTVRTAFSNDNYTFMRSFNEMLNKLQDGATGKPASIGEIVRRSKNYLSGYQSKYKFHLLCDPLLELAIPTMKLAVTEYSSKVTPGTTTRFAGRVNTPAGTTASNFNGEIVLKWYKPAYKDKVHSKVCNEVSTDIDSIRYESEVAAMQAYSVKNGRFDIEVEVPALLSDYKGNNILLTICAYDATQRLGGVWKYRPAIIAGDSGGPASDTEHPVIEQFIATGYDNASLLPESFTLLLKATDNAGLRIDEKSFDSPLVINIDGKNEAANVADFATMADGGKTLAINYPVKGLAPGHHSITAEVTDYSGNRSKAEYTFEVGVAEGAAPLLTETLCRTQATLTLPSETAQEIAVGEILLTDAQGNPVATLPCSSATTVTWNLTNHNGIRVKTGLYKAYVRYTDRNGRSAVSKGAYVPVL